jgi:hypothetical protein
MKNHLTLFAALSVLIASRGLSQTTLEEYNYLTKGYKVQIESGLDMKSGYSFENVTESKVMSGDSSYVKTEFKGLIRKGEKKPCAILCIYSEVDANQIQKTDYICIPHTESTKEVWAMAFKKISEYTGDAANVLNLGLMHLSAHYGMK